MADAHDPDQLAFGLKDSATYYRAPAAFSRRLRRSLRSSAPAPTRWVAARGWLALAASFACGALLSWALTFTQKTTTEAELPRELVASHIRSLMAGHLADVASTDAHTVKPWFAGKLDFSPPVVTDAAAGFTLVGGRLDYVGQRSVAALVYRVRGHLINVFIWPSASPTEPLQTMSRQGYELVHLGREHMDYWLVSDLNRSELTGFAEALANAAPQG